MPQQTKHPFSIPNNIVFTELDEEEAVLLNVITKKYYSLNETGILIWTKLQEGLTIQEISKAMTDIYEIDGASASNYIQSFIDELADEGIVETTT